MARVNIAAFNREKLDAIIVNSAGCGATMKEYADLLDGDLEAVLFSAKVKDADGDYKPITTAAFSSSRLAPAAKIPAEPIQLWKDRLASGVFSASA